MNDYMTVGGDEDGDEDEDPDAEDGSNSQEGGEETSD